MGLWVKGRQFIKEKGIFISKKIPIGSKPLDIDHAMYKALNREKLKKTLEKAQELIDTILLTGETPNKLNLELVAKEIQRRLEELEERIK